MLKIKDSSNNILLILNITNNINDIIENTVKIKNIENIDSESLVDLYYDTDINNNPSFIKINDNIQNIFLNNNEVILDNILKLNQENKIFFNFKNFKIDINPMLTIDNYSFTFKFIIEKFPCKIHILYESSYDNDSLIILTENLK